MITTEPLMVINKKKRQYEPELFPGYQLNRNLQTLQYGAVVIGRVFEKITEKALGAQCQTVDSHSDLCPDVSGVNMIAESKAFRANGTLLLKHDQLANYAKQTEFKTVTYCLWAYSHKRPVGNPNKTTEGECVRNVISTIAAGYFFDVSIITKLREYEGKLEGVNYRHCRMWFKEQGVIHRDFLTVKNRVLQDFAVSPFISLGRIGLKTTDYESNIERRRITFEYEQCRFTTRLFPVFKIAKKNGEVPF